MGLEPSNLPPPSPGPGAAAGLARSGSGSIGGAAALFAKEFASMGFSEADKKKIMENDHLAQIALTDPKKVKRFVSSRELALGSPCGRLNKMFFFLTEIEHLVKFSGF